MLKIYLSLFYFQNIVHGIESSLLKNECSYFVTMKKFGLGKSFFVEFFASILVLYGTTARKMHVEEILKSWRIYLPFADATLRSNYLTLRVAKVSVADPGCLSRIPDTKFFHPRSRTTDPNFFHAGSRIRIKEFKYRYFN